MGSLLERLEAREAAARARVDGLRAELDRLAERLAAEQELLGRLEITRQTIIEVLAGGDSDGDGDGEDGEDPGLDVGAATVSGSQHAALSQTAPTPVGTGMQVAVFIPGGEVDGRRLPVAYRDVVEVLADAGVGLRAMQVCQALGVGTEPRHREGMRVKLKRLVKRGWLVEVEPGVFTCARDVAAALDLDGGQPGPGPQPRR
jgi:hypothetical protein